MDAGPGMQDVLGQLPFLKTYAHLLLCFPFPNYFDRQKTINALQIAIHRMILAFPWLGDCVLHHGVTAASSGMLTTAPHHALVVPEILVVKDHLEMPPTYQDIVSAKGAISSFDGTVLSPRNAFPQSCRRESRFGCCCWLSVASVSSRFHRYWIGLSMFNSRMADLQALRCQSCTTYLLQYSVYTWPISLGYLEHRGVFEHDSGHTLADARNEAVLF